MMAKAINAAQFARKTTVKSRLYVEKKFHLKKR